MTAPRWWAKAPRSRPAVSVSAPARAGASAPALGGVCAGDSTSPAPALPDSADSNTMSERAAMRFSRCAYAGSSMRAGGRTQACAANSLRRRKPRRGKGVGRLVLHGDREARRAPGPGGGRRANAEHSTVPRPRHCAPGSTETWQMWPLVRDRGWPGARRPCRSALGDERGSGSKRPHPDRSTSVSTKLRHRGGVAYVRFSAASRLPWWLRWMTGPAARSPRAAARAA